MNLMMFLEESFRKIKWRLRDNSHDSVLWIVNLVPSLAGFSFYKDSLSVPFWILHLSLQSYLYVVGSAVFLIEDANGAGDYIRSYVNISILISLFSMSYWFLKNRPLLRAVLKKTKQHDELARKSPALREKHERLLFVTKVILIIFYGLNCLNAATVYIPRRTSLTSDYAMQPCVGMEPLTASPKREICTALLVIQELTIMTVALNFQALLLFLISHTAIMYQLLSDEIMALNSTEHTEVKEKLPHFIERHILTLDIIDKLKSLYSAPLGINFASNAICIAFFFYMSLKEMVTFMPIMVYCFLVFFLYCFLCQKLINAAEVFERAVYACGWENFDVNEKKMIYLMVMLAQRKVEILAADIIPVNIYTFAVTLQSMFKFVTVMKF